MTKWLTVVDRLPGALRVALPVVRMLLLVGVWALAGHGALDAARARRLCESLLSSPAFSLAQGSSPLNFPPMSGISTR